MDDGKLNNRQFVTVALVIIFCGVAILGHDYFLAKKQSTYDQMSIALSDITDPNESESVDGEEDVADVTPAPVISTPVNNTTTNDNSGDTNNQESVRHRQNDTSGRVKKKSVTYNYVGRIIIPVIGLNRGFLKYGAPGNNVNQNVAVMGGSDYPNVPGSNLILAAHNGSGWNAYFTKIDKLKMGALAYVQYDGKQYKYKLVKSYSDPKGDRKVNVYKNGVVKQLTLITCKRPDYKKYYLVLVFELVNEVDCNGQCK